MGDDASGGYYLHNKFHDLYWSAMVQYGREDSGRRDTIEN